MYASERGHVKTVLEMIPFAKTKDLEEALRWAAEGGHFPLLSALLENSEISPDLTPDLTPKNTRYGSFADHETAFLLATRSPEPETALFLATRSLEPKSVQALLEKGARVHIESIAQTPLHALAQARINSKTEAAAREIMSMLLAAGNDIEARDGNDKTPLFSAIEGDYSASKTMMSVNLFLSSGANPCAMDCDEQTLLHVACKSSSRGELVSRLLECEANPREPRSSDGATPIHWWVWSPYSPITMSVWTFGPSHWSNNAELSHI